MPSDSDIESPFLICLVGSLVVSCKMVFDRHSSMPSLGLCVVSESGAQTKISDAQGRGQLQSVSKKRRGLNTEAEWRCQESSRKSGTWWGVSEVKRETRDGGLSRRRVAAETTHHTVK